MRSSKFKVGFWVALLLASIFRLQYATASTDEIRAVFEEQNRKIFLLRDQITKNPDRFLKELSTKLDPRFASGALGADNFQRTINASVAHVGCIGDDIQVVGFFNVVEHVWFFAWVDKNASIVSTRISLGFTPKSYPTDNAWYDLLEQNGLIEPAMRRSATIQRNSFTRLFPGSNCVDSKNFENLFTQTAALATLFENFHEFSKISELVILKTTEATLLNLRDSVGLVKSEQDLVLSAAIRGIAGSDLLTIHTVKRNPSIIILQWWEINGFDVAREGERVFLLGEEE